MSTLVYLNIRYSTMAKGIYKTVYFKVLLIIVGLVTKLIINMRFPSHDTIKEDKTERLIRGANHSKRLHETFEIFTLFIGLKYFYISKAF